MLSTVLPTGPSLVEIPEQACAFPPGLLSLQALGGPGCSPGPPWGGTSPCWTAARPAPSGLVWPRTVWNLPVRLKSRQLVVQPSGRPGRLVAGKLCSGQSAPDEEEEPGRHAQAPWGEDWTPPREPPEVEDTAQLEAGHYLLAGSDVLGPGQCPAGPEL